MREIGDKMKKMRFCPDLTDFYVKSSESYKEEFMKTIRYEYKKVQKYDAKTTQNDYSKEFFIEMISNLNHDHEHGMDLPNFEQISQLSSSKNNKSFRGYENDDDHVRFQELNNSGGGSSKKMEPILEEIHDVLRNIPKVLEDYDMGSQSARMEMNEMSAGSYNFNDFGGLDEMMERRPEDFVTPSNIFEKAAQKLDMIDKSLRQYNMKRDLKITEMRSNTEVFGPDRLQTVREKLLKRYKIVGDKVAPSKKRENKGTGVEIDFSLSTDEVFRDDFMPELKEKMKRSRKLPNLESITINEQKFVLPLEFELKLTFFNSLFTRGVRDYDLDEILPEQVKVEAGDPAAEVRNQSGFDGFTQANNIGLADDLGDQMPGDNFEQHFDPADFQAGGRRGSGEEFNPQQPLGDLEGVNLLNNYLNYKPNENLAHLEKKLTQNFNFEITDFKDYLLRNYILQIHPNKPSQVGIASNFSRTSLADHPG